MSIVHQQLNRSNPDQVQFFIYILTVFVSSVSLLYCVSLNYFINLINIHVLLNCTSMKSDMISILLTFVPRVSGQSWHKRLLVNNTILVNEQINKCNCGEHILINLRLYKPYTRFQDRLYCIQRMHLQKSLRQKPHFYTVEEHYH